MFQQQLVTLGIQNVHNFLLLHALDALGETHKVIMDMSFILESCGKSFQVGYVFWL